MGGLWILVAIAASFVNGIVAFYFITHNIWMDVILFLMGACVWIKHRSNEKRRLALRIKARARINQIQSEADRFASIRDIRWTSLNGDASRTAVDEPADEDYEDDSAIGYDGPTVDLSEFK